MKLLGGFAMVESQNYGISLEAVHTRMLRQIDEQLQVHHFQADDGVRYGSSFVLLGVLLIMPGAVCSVAGFA